MPDPASKQADDPTGANPVHLREEFDLRTRLAADRTVFAAERTYAAWVRTALAALASGVGGRAVLEQVVPLWLARAIGTVLILFAVFCLCAAIWRELYGAPEARARVIPLPRYLFLPLNFLLVLVTLAALVGVWIT